MSYLRVFAPSDSRARSAFTYGLTPVVLSAFIDRPEMIGGTRRSGGEVRSLKSPAFVKELSELRLCHIFAPCKQ